ncbi:dienelactone hydrolase family protein [soil metagenome]
MFGASAGVPAGHDEPAERPALRKTLKLLRCLMALAPCVGLAAPAMAQGTVRGTAREELVRIPAAGGTAMVATILRPPGDDRKPLVVINHCSPADSSQRPTMERPRYTALSSWFLSRGYVVVLPLRRGYGESGGSWVENYGPCSSPDYAGAGLQGAADIRAAIDYMRGKPFVAPDHTIVIGQSAGGWATLALSSLNPPGVPGMIDFAGGRGGHQKLAGGGLGNCAPDALVKAAGRYGATARVPTLWLYAENDSFFGPALARRMVDAYSAAGGRAIYRPLGAFGSDGHTLAASSSGAPIWSGPMAEFLATLK